MGAWALRPHGIEFLTSNQAESFNSQMKRFIGTKEQPIEMMVLSILRFTEFRENEVKIAQYRVGGQWVLRKHLVTKYNRNDPNVILPRIIPDEEYINRVKAATSERIQLDEVRIERNSLFTLIPAVFIFIGDLSSSVPFK